MKYLKPEMDIVEFDESVLTMNTGNSSFDNIGGEGSPINGQTTVDEIQ